MSFRYAYNCDYENFIKHYEKESPKDHTHGCVCRGIAFSLDFCKKILSSSIKFPDYVYKAAHSKLIMNNIVDVEGCKKYKPFCIWYPQLPSVETCYKLIDIGGDLLYSVAIVSILIGDLSLWNSCGNIKDRFLYNLAVRCNRPWVPPHASTVINLHSETIDKADRMYISEVDDFFNFKPESTNNVFHYPYANYYCYAYPLGLHYLYKNGIENHMIKRKNLTYICDEDGPYEEPDDWW